MRILYFLLFTSVASLHAGFVWDNSVIEHKAPYGETEFVAKFPFTVEGEGEFEVIGIRASCGCTTPMLAKRKYNSGESAELEAVFTYGRRTGLQEKLITVRVLEFGEEKEYRLNLKVEIPVLLKVEPRVLSWFMGSDPVQKEAILELPEDLPYFIELESLPNDSFYVEPVWSEGRKQLKLLIRPKDLSERQTFRISINVMEDAQVITNKSLYSIIRPGK